MAIKMNCPNCSADIRDGARFCDHCGSPTAGKSQHHPRNGPTRTVVFALSLAALCMAAWLYASPYMMLRNFEQAIDAKDADAIAKYVDFSAVRASLKEEYRAEMTNRIADTLKDNSDPFAALGAGIGIALGDKLADSMIDALVSPGSIRALIERAGGGQPEAGESNWPKFRTTYESFNQFVVHPGKEDGGLILRRTGLGWKLAGVRLPHGQAPQSERLFPRTSGSDYQRGEVAKSQIDNFLTALGTYKLDTGVFPSTEQGLRALCLKPEGVSSWNGPYMPRAIPEDPWGHAYVYQYPGTHGDGPDIICYGADGKPSGEGADADIVSWKPRE